MNKNFLTILSILFCFSIKAQEKPKWDVNEFGKQGKSISFTVSEGTWMNLDVSPDGKEIVFDLLGDIYIMPSSGGEAKVIRKGHALEVQPRFSPDGKKIVFTSDAGGGDNIWFMNKDGSNAQQITKEDFRLLNNPIWMPDGQYIVARKHFTSRRSAGAGELWMYHISGGSGIQLTIKKNEQQDLNEPSASPDGKYIYYSEDVYPGGYFQYNKDPNKLIYAIKRYNIENGTNETIISSNGGAVRPQISRDGKKLAFVKRVREKTVLYIKNLENGLEIPVYDELSKDQQEAWAIFGVYTNFNWSPDDRFIYIWAKGKIRKIEIASGKAEIIPFTAKCEHNIVDANYFPQNPLPENIDIKAIRTTVIHPNDKEIVFNAVGYLWKKLLPDSKPERLTSQQDFEFEPAFSYDGKFLYFVTWNDTAMGSICKMDWNNPKNIQKLTKEKAIYRQVAVSPDGKLLAYLKEGGNTHQGYAFCVEPGIYIMDLSTLKTEKIAEDGEFPQFSKDNKTLWFQTGGSLFGDSKELKAYSLEKKSISTVCNSKYTTRFSISPDNQWLLFTELFKVYLTPFPKTGKNLEISAENKALPVKRVAETAGVYPHWSFDSKKVHWVHGGQYYTADLKNQFTFIPGAPDSLPAPVSKGVPINLSLKPDIPKGYKVFKNANIITMEDSVIIQNGVIVVKDNKIEAVGKENEVNILKDAQIFDLQGKYVMPGIIDVHAHPGSFRYGLSPQKHWQYYSELAFGVTTVHDPSAHSEMIFSQSEMIKVGNMVGPRVFSTGTILYGADGDFKAVINTAEDAFFHVNKTKDWGSFSIKSYNQPRRDQRQQVIQEAKKLGIMVYPEGGSHFLHNFTMILDGHTSVEHNIPVAPLHEDVIQVWKNAKTANAPTLVVSYGSISGEYFWYQNTNVWENKRLLNFTPRSIVDARARHRTMIPDEEYKNGHILVSQSCKKLLDEGVTIGVGGHGQMPGIDAHWEIWLLQQGGMTNYQALKCATVNGAKYIGMSDYIGSIKKGKLADFIVLEKNPLENIRNTESIVYTIANGRVYDAMTLDEINGKKRTPFYWEANPYPLNFDWHEYNQVKCHCGK